MKIEKIKNWDNTYDIKFIKDGKTLTILFSRVLDLYMVMEDGERIPFRTPKTIEFDITADDSLEVYKIFDELYNNVTEGNIFERKEKSKPIDSSLICGYNLLVDENKSITWISDDGMMEQEDKMQISRVDGFYRLTFVRNDIPLDYGFKSPEGIYVRLRTSGSRYDPFHIPFMKMYHSLQNIDENLSNSSDISKVKKKVRE